MIYKFKYTIKGFSSTQVDFVVSEDIKKAIEMFVLSCPEAFILSIKTIKGQDDGILLQKDMLD